MSIKKLTVRNIKKISFAEIEPESEVVEIHGKNAQGKTSILQAIMMAFGGKTEFGEMPIKEGEERAEIVVEKDDMKIIRKLKRVQGGSIATQLAVMDKSGNVIRRPQEFLDKALGSAMLDPTEFVSMSSKERRVALQEALGIKQDFDELDMERGRIYNERTQLGREVGKIDGRLMEYDDLEKDDIDELQNQSDIDEVMRKSAEIEKLFDRERNAAEERRKSNERMDFLKNKQSECQIKIKEGRDDKEENDEEIRRYKGMIRELEAENRGLDEAVETYENSKKKLEAEEADLMFEMGKGYTVPKDKIQEHEELKGELKQLVQNTKENERRASKRRLQEEHRQLREKLDAHTGQIKAIDEKKKSLLRETKFPVPGMAFGEDDIEMDGIPFTSSSTAEQILMSVVINSKIKNDIKIMRIPDGSMLDDKAIKKLRQMAIENGLQIWIESVSRDHKDNVLVIEEGRIQK